MKPERPLRNKVKQARLRMGLSQQELAQAIGVTRQTISAVEGGVISPSTTVALGLAQVLGCQVEDLFWLEGEIPELDVKMVSDAPLHGSLRCSVARVDGRWLAYPLVGDRAFHTELIPADGISILLSEGAEHDANEARVQLLDRLEQLERVVVVAGCLPELSLWVRAAERTHPGLRVHSLFANSSDALNMLDRGEVHIAGVHYYDPVANEHNLPLVRRLLPHRDVVLINFGIWEEGLLVQPRNPRHIKEIADLARDGIQIVNREAGAGARFLLQQSLEQAGISSDAVSGFTREVRGHLEVAQAVASGAVDAGVSTASVAAAFGLDFIPLQQVRYDFAVRTTYMEDEWVKQLLGTLGNRWVLAQLAALGGYDTSQSGEVMATVKADKVRQGR